MTRRSQFGAGSSSNQVPLNASTFSLGDDGPASSFADISSVAGTSPIASRELVVALFGDGTAQTYDPESDYADIGAAFNQAHADAATGGVTVYIPPASSFSTTMQPTAQPSTTVFPGTGTKIQFTGSGYAYRMSENLHEVYNFFLDGDGDTGSDVSCFQWDGDSSPHCRIQNGRIEDFSGSAVRCAGAGAEMWESTIQHIRVSDIYSPAGIIDLGGTDDTVDTAGVTVDDVNMRAGDANGPLVAFEANGINKQISRCIAEPATSGDYCFNVRKGRNAKIFSNKAEPSSATGDSTGGFKIQNNNGCFVAGNIAFLCDDRGFDFNNVDGMWFGGNVETQTQGAAHGVYIDTGGVSQIHAAGNNIENGWTNLNNISSGEINGRTAGQTEYYASSTVAIIRNDGTGQLEEEEDDGTTTTLTP